MSISQIVGIVGRKGHGKNAVGDYLSEAHGYKQIAFADDVKNVCKRLFPHLSDAQLWGPIELKEALDIKTGVTPRWLLQQIGTQGGRQCQFDIFESFGISSGQFEMALSLTAVFPGPTAWIDSLFGRLKYSGPGKYVITDVRFPNEAQAILAHGGAILKVTRPGYDTGAFNDHASETEVANCPWSFELRNEGTLQDLYSNIEHLLRTMEAARE